ncbi:MAG: NUDIX hydrolase [Deltaproteobacteria bacterium]|nr:NUDIX hydrolase [Deltaproteobacteria bacterium]
MHHSYEFQYCPVCGGGLKSSILKDNEPARLICTECDFIFYQDPKLVACTIVEIDNKIVLLKRGVEPERGKWVMPGGYVDRGEKVEAAAVRETSEECGIQVRVKNLMGIYSYTGQIEAVVVYVSEHLSGELIVGDETLEVKLLSPRDIPWDDLAFQSTVDALRDYCRLKSEI